MNIIEESIDLGQIKQNYEVHQNLLNELHGMIISCARKIKIFTIIAQNKKSLVELDGESFWGWLQIEALCPQIILSCFKIAERIHTFISDFLKLVLPVHLVKALKKESKLSNGVSALEIQTQQFKEYRNKRAAHIECVNVENVTIEMNPLYECLCSIDLSLNYISHF